jgi:hypothetical protein
MTSTPRRWALFGQAHGAVRRRAAGLPPLLRVANGDASTIITTFPFRKPGVYGRRGTNQTRTIMQAIPVGAAGLLGGPAERSTASRPRRAPLRPDPRDVRPSLRHPARAGGKPRRHARPIVNDAQGIGAEHASAGSMAGRCGDGCRSAMDEFLTIGMQFRREGRYARGQHVGRAAERRAALGGRGHHRPRQPAGHLDAGRRHGPPPRASTPATRKTRSR